MKRKNPHRPRKRPAAGSARPARPPAFFKRKAPPDLQRGLFTLFLDDADGQHISQVWATSAASAAALMAPWSKDRLRHAEPPAELPVELVGWDFPGLREELAEESGIPPDEVDPGCCGMELHHVWSAEHTREDGAKSTLYVIETIGFDQGLGDEPWSERPETCLTR